jgi:hypothetical protein
VIAWRIVQVSPLLGIRGRTDCDAMNAARGSFDQYRVLLPTRQLATKKGGFSMKLDSPKASQLPADETKNRCSPVECCKRGEVEDADEGEEMHGCMGRPLISYQTAQ